jgi:branched-subunit amino acid ABC-type transport system permease component
MAKLVMTRKDFQHVADGRYWEANRSRLITFWSAALVVIIGAEVAGERISDTLSAIIMAFGMLLFVASYAQVVFGSVKNSKAKLKEWASDAEALKT